jgi:hypothetical protein
MKKQTKEIGNGIISGIIASFIIEILKTLWNTIIYKIDINSSLQLSIESMKSNPLRIILLTTLFVFIGIFINFLKIKK